MTVTKTVFLTLLLFKIVLTESILFKTLIIMTNWLKITLVLLICMSSCNDKNSPQPQELTTLEGRVLNADNSTPVDNIDLNLLALYKNDERIYTEQLFRTNQKGEFSIAFKASSDSAYTIEIANAPTWYQSTFPYNSPNSPINNNFQRGIKQTKDLWICGAGFIQVVPMDSSKIQCDTLEVQTKYSSCSLDPNYGYKVKAAKAQFKNIEPFPMPSPQKPVMLWKAYKAGKVVFEKRDTIALSKQGETLNYKIVF
jgi:hypothetical protein